MSDPNPCARAGLPHRGAVLALLLAATASTAVAAAPLGFAEALHLAVERAPQLDARRSRAAAAREELARADALPDPKLMAGIQNLPIGGSDAFSVEADRMTMRRIGLSQEFPSRAKRQARRVRAEAELVEARAEGIATELEVQRAAAEAWITLWAAEREFANLKALEEQSELAVSASRARLSGGGGMATDVLAARSAELELANRLVSTETRIAQARAALARWLGAAPESVAANAPEFRRAPLAKAALLAQLDRHGDLLLWDAREAAAEAELELERAEKRPDWALSGGYAQRGADASDAVWLEVSIDLPLFARNRQDRGIAARRAELDAVHAEREAARRAQVERVGSLFAAWSGLRQQVQRHEAQILPLAEDRAEIALAAFSGGAPLQAWIDARRDDLAVRTLHAEMLARLGRAWVELAFLLPQESAE